MNAIFFCTATYNSRTQKYGGLLPLYVLKRTSGKKIIHHCGCMYGACLSHDNGDDAPHDMKVRVIPIHHTHAEDGVGKTLQTIPQWDTMTGQRTTSFAVSVGVRVDREMKETQIFFLNLLDIRNV